MSNILKGLQLNELSNDKLGQYKKAAGADAKKADSEGDYKRGDKRFSGIVRATNKQFANDEKNLKEFAPAGGDDHEPNEEEILRQLAAKWWLGTEQEMAKAQKTLEVMGWEIGQDESGDDAAGVFVIRAGDENGDSYIAFNHSDLEELNEAYNNYHANRTGFTRPKRDLSGEGEPEGMFMVMIDGRPWKEFTSNQAFQRAKSIATKNPDRKVQVRWPNGQLNTVAEGRYDFSDYHDARLRGDYGMDLPANTSGSTYKELNKGDGTGERGRPQRLKGVSKKLPADPFGRTTGEIPAGKPGRVHSMMNDIDEDWSQKYKSSINCSHPKGFSQKAHCAGKKKHNESIEMEMVCEDCGMCETHVDHTNLDEACWKGYHKEGNKKMFGKTYPNCVKNTNEEQLDEKCWDTHKQVGMKSKGGKQVPNCVPKESIEEQHSETCPHCGGKMVSEELMNEKKDACYYKVKSRYKVWPSAYASGALVKCRNKGASNWGTGGKKNESSILEGIEQADESLHDWFNKEKWVRMDTKGKIKGPCAREPGEGKPKCLPQAKAHSLGKKGRASAAQRKRREDPNPERSGKAINVDTKKSKG